MINPLTNDHILTPHGFFSRQGGVSEGYFKSLNCGHQKGDLYENVEQNRSLILEYFYKKYPSSFKNTPPKLVLCKQEHTNIPLWIEGPLSDPLPVADALVTKTKGLIIGILTADCCPILMIDSKNQIIAAVHAGWKGALSGIIQNTVDMMIRKGAKLENIVSVIGPCLSVDHFEVKSDFINMLKNQTPFETDPFIILKDGAFFFDFVPYVRELLQRRGILNIHSSYKDTYSNPDLFFSYRRKTHNNEPFFGTQLSAIGLV